MNRRTLMQIGAVGAASVTAAEASTAAVKIIDREDSVTVGKTKPWPTVEELRKRAAAVLAFKEQEIRREPSAAELKMAVDEHMESIYADLKQAAEAGRTEIDYWCGNNYAFDDPALHLSWSDRRRTTERAVDIVVDRLLAAGFTSVLTRQHSLVLTINIVV